MFWGRNLAAWFAADNTHAQPFFKKLKNGPSFRATPRLLGRGRRFLGAKTDHRLHGLEFLLRIAAEIRNAVLEQDDEAERRGHEEGKPKDGADESHE